MSSSSNNSSSSSSTSSMISLSSAVLAVVAATAASHYYYKNATKTTSAVSRDISDTTPSKDDATTSRLKTWDDRWKTGRIAFHKTDVHASLRKYCDDYILESIIGGGAKILVPLCGKTVDMVYLSQKRPVGEVIGIDGIPKSIKEFITENPELNIIEQPLPPSTTTATTTNVETTVVQKYQGDKISLYVNDFFNVTLQDIGNVPVDGIWDRGSLVAIEPSLREQYVQQISQFIKKPNGKYLLVAVVRSTTAGPPYSIDQAEVQRLFGKQDWVDSIQLLDSHAMPSSSYYEMITSYWRLGSIKEEVYIITTK